MAGFGDTGPGSIYRAVRLVVVGSLVGFLGSIFLLGVLVGWALA